MSSCSFEVTGDRMYPQRVWECEPCGYTLADGKGMCSSCAQICHAKPDCEPVMAVFGGCFCDCGATSTESGCQAFVAANTRKLVVSLPPELSPGIANNIVPFRAWDSCFPSSTVTETLAALRGEAVLVTAASKESFWLDNTVERTCLLEELAWQVCSKHTQNILKQNNSENDVTVGCEWWVQNKPRNGPATETQIGLHYDTDYYVNQRYDIGVFPVLSTVTYLTSGGWPTLVTENTITDTVGSDIDTVHISRARAGKHIAFDGRFLHGVPPLPEFEDVKQFESKDNRVTFLVNVWINHKPSGIEPLSSIIASSLSPSTTSLELKWNSADRQSSHQIIDQCPDHVRVSVPFLGQDNPVTSYADSVDVKQMSNMLLTEVIEGVENIDEQEEALVLMLGLPDEGLSQSYHSYSLKYASGHEAFLTYAEDSYLASDQDDSPEELYTPA